MTEPADFLLRVAWSPTLVRLPKSVAAWVHVRPMTLLFDPLGDLLFHEPDIRLDADVRYESALNVAVDCLYVDFEQRFKFLCCK